MLRLLFFAIFLVFLCAVTPVIAAEQPPPHVSAYIKQFPLVHRGTCEIDDNKVKCLIFRDEANDVDWVVRFNDKFEPTHIYGVQKGEGVIVWIRSDLTS